MERTQIFLIGVSGSLARVFIYLLALRRVCCYFKAIRDHIITPAAEPTLYPHAGSTPLPCLFLSHPR